MSCFAGRIVLQAVGYLASVQINGPVAQLDRASVFGTEGWGFEPLRGHHHANSVCEKAVRSLPGLVRPFQLTQDLRPIGVAQGRLWAIEFRP